MPLYHCLHDSVLLDEPTWLELWKDPTVAFQQKRKKSDVKTFIMCSILAYYGVRSRVIRGEKCSAFEKNPVPMFRVS
jgi:beta-lactamase class D